MNDSPSMFERNVDPAPSTALIRVSPHARRVEAWALALSSKGMPSLRREVDGAYELHVAPWDAARAEAELTASDEEETAAERARAVVVTEERLPATSTRSAAVGAGLVAALLLAFFSVTGPRADGARWFAVGAAEAQRVVHGEWWRAVTALTLHADSAHVISNVGLGTLVLGAVMRSEGVGMGSALVLASGVAGNLINAWAHQLRHSSVGFSTAVFGAIGILGGLAFAEARRQRSTRRPAWTALAGTLALLALLGTSDKGNVDMLAHVFGAAAGVCLGALAVYLPNLHTRGQWLAGLGSAALVAGAWLRALA